jgi:hypothetical protein
MAQEKIVLKLKKNEISLLPPSVRHPQLKFTEEKLLEKSRMPGEKEKMQQYLTQWSPTILLPIQAIEYLDTMLAPPYPDKGTGTGHYYHPRESNTSDQIYSLIIPIKNPTNQQVLQFRLVRDHQRDFTTDGRALLLTIKQYTYGVIYFGDPHFYTRRPIRANPQTHEEIRELLSVSIETIMLEIALDPKQYFSRMGQKCGLCMICGRALSDDDSKRHGYGPVCGRIWRLLLPR